MLIILRCLPCLFFSIFLSGKIKAQISLTKPAIEIENMRDFIRQKILADTDSVGLQKIVDSIAKESKWEKTEYARLYTMYEGNSDKFNNIFSTKDSKRLSAIIASFKSPAIKAFCKFNAGEWLCNQGEYTGGMELMLEALSECKAIGYKNIPRIYILFYLTGNRYYNFNNYRKCLEYARLAAQFGIRKETIGLNNTAGLAYQKIELYDSAAIQFRETIRQAQIFKIPAWEYIASGNLGHNYCLQKKYTEGIPLLYVDVVKDSAAEPINASVSALYIAEAFCNLNQPDSAAFFIGLSKNIFTRYHQWKDNIFFGSKLCWFYYQVMAQWLQLNGRYPEALLYADTVRLHEKKLNSHLDWQLLTSTEKRIDGLEYQKDIALLDSEKKNEQLQKILLFIILGSVLIIALLIIKRQRLKQQKERQLAQEKEANFLLKEAQARRELETARQQLDDFMNRLDEKNNMLEQMTATLISIKGTAASGPETENINQQLARLANTTLLTQSDWEDFQKRFEKVYPGFFISLAVSLPGISPAEERLVALLKLKISYRQMASMLGISLESVRTAKYRLRKKLATTGSSELYLLLDDVSIPAA